MELVQKTKEELEREAVEAATKQAQETHMLKKLYPGTKLYKVIDDNTVEVLRVIRYRNSNTIELIEDEKFNSTKSLVAGNRISKTPEELIEYTALAPTGYGTISLVATGKNTKDVIVSMILRDGKDSIPFCACRQWINDLYSETIKTKGHEEDVWFGMSMSKATCPANVDYNQLFACDGVLDSNICSLYLNDSLDSMLALLPAANYSSVLWEIYHKLKDSKIKGICKNVRDLLVQNRFWEDVQQGFNILPVDFKIDNVDNNYVLSEINLQKLEYVIKTKIEDIHIVPYTHFINLDAVAGTKLFLCDASGKVYVVSFVQIDGFNPDLYPAEAKYDLTQLSYGKYTL